MLIAITFGTPAHDESVRLREEVLRRPLGLVFSPEEMEAEAEQIHLGWYSPSLELRACLLFKPMDEGQTYKMRQVAVWPQLQGQGIGRLLVRAAEQYALRQGCTHIMMHAREEVLPFYTRLGYAKYGRKFEEVTVPHYKMRKDIG